MDTLRGNFGNLTGDTSPDDDAYLEDDDTIEAPPGPVGQDERRMQVRAYNHWASLLDERNFPSISDLKPDELPDFGPFSVLLDFTGGIENPGISYLGEEIAEECGTQTGIGRLDDIPSRSLLSRITDHYMQILANQAPIGFEAEFINQREKTILYRGILLPFSSDDETIDFIYGVINWKELADAQTTDELLLEIDQALAKAPEPVEPEANTDLSEELSAPQPSIDPIADWADGPGTETAGEHFSEDAEEAFDDVVDLSGFEDDGEASLQDDDPSELPTPGFGSLTGGGFAAGKSSAKRDALTDAQPPHIAEPVVEFPAEENPAPQADAFDKAKLLQGDDAAEREEAPVTGALDALHDSPIELPDFAPETLADWLALARESASEARATEDRSRRALYDAIGQAYDFALAVDQAPEEFAEILSDAGLEVQDRAPMTPIVKLVFGVDYDKTRLTEYAAALSFAKREGVAQGEMAVFVAQFDGGLKGVVAAERAVRRSDSGKPAKAQPAVRGKIAKTLRTMQPVSLDSIDAQGEEFALVMVRREADGSLCVIGEVPADNALVAKAARKLAEHAN